MVGVRMCLLSGSGSERSFSMDWMTTLGVNGVGGVERSFLSSDLSTSLGCFNLSISLLMIFE